MPTIDALKRFEGGGPSSAVTFSLLVDTDYALRIAGFDSFGRDVSELNISDPVVVEKGIAASGIEMTIFADTFNYNIFENFGSPLSATNAVLNIDTSVTVGSSKTCLPALETGIGWPVGSTLRINNLGRIQGTGGDGGQSGGDATTTGTAPFQSFIDGGGGGGGAGSIVGLGGIGGEQPVPGNDTNDGADGTSEAGGAGGTPSALDPSGESRLPGSGSPGGAAFRVQFNTTLNNVSGEIWAGGGGGGGCGDALSTTSEHKGGKGGNPGEDGAAGGGAGNTGLGGDAGLSIDEIGGTVTFTDADQGDLKGAIDFGKQTVSIDFDGSTERMFNDIGQLLGITNSWSLAFWYKPGATTFTQTSRLFTRRSPAASNDAIICSIQAAEANDPLFIQLDDNASTVFKQYRWNNLATQDAWNFTVITWDGTDLLLYHDGTLTAPTTKNIDNAGTMGDSTRKLALGGDIITSSLFAGRMHSVGVWDSVLSDAEQTELYNAGDGNAVNWAKDGTNYLSSANLPHWWRLGDDCEDIGADFGNKTPDINVGDDAVGITEADIVEDSP